MATAPLMLFPEIILSVVSTSLVISCSSGGSLFTHLTTFVLTSSLTNHLPLQRNLGLCGLMDLGLFLCFFH